MQPDLCDALLRARIASDRTDAVLAALPRPDASKWNPDPDYLRSLLERAGLTQRDAATLLDVGYRQFRHFCTGKREAPYTVQYALEMLALLNIPENNR